MICERCGNTIANTAAICPFCGTPSRVAQGGPQPPTGYGQMPGQGFSGGNPYEQGYAPPVAQQPGYGPQSYVPPVYPQPMPSVPPHVPPMGYVQGVNVTVVNTGPQKNDGALIAEILLSLIGIYGVGWLIAGETTVGVILLVCSFVLYMPIVILGTIFTLGLGLICLGPLAIAAIIVNAVLLNSLLNRKVAQYIMMMQQPPRY